MKKRKNKKYLRKILKFLQKVFSTYIKTGQLSSRTIKILLKILYFTNIFWIRKAFTRIICNQRSGRRVGAGAVRVERRLSQQ